ncbi:hypothetical protein SFIMM107S_03669 [Streptomyces griseus]
MTVNANTSVAGGNTWRDLPAAQQPEYPDSEALRDVLADLASYPPLVFAGECDQLRARLGAVAKGEAFLLQGGDCAEAFDAVSAEHIRAKLKTLLQMSAVLTYAASVPVVKVGRIAGQYSKPRSKSTETRDGVTLPTYRGDSVNGFAFTEEARVPDPARLKQMYHASSSTLNLVRAFTTGGYADLRQVHAWNQDFVKSSPAGQRYEALAREIDNALELHEGVRHRPGRVQGGRVLRLARGAAAGSSRLAPPAPDTTHVMVWAEYGFSSNLRLADFASEHTLFATHKDGELLTAEHGFPLRLVVPHLYAWKGPKWVRGIEYMTADRRGFWEERGYHNIGDPWSEQRYSYQEEPGDGPEL